MQVVVAESRKKNEQRNGPLGYYLEMISGKRYVHVALADKTSSENALVLHSCRIAQEKKVRSLGCYPFYVLRATTSPGPTSRRYKIPRLQISQVRQRLQKGPTTHPMSTALEPIRLLRIATEKKSDPPWHSLLKEKDVPQSDIARQKHITLTMFSQANNRSKLQSI